MGKLDRYVAKAVLGAWAAGLLFMTLLFVLIDVLVEFGDRVERAEAEGIGGLAIAEHAVRYYALSLPVVYVTVAPFVSVVAGMFAVSRLMAANEIVPMLFTGRSMLRILRPVIAMGTGTALLMVGCWAWLIPSIAESLDAARQRIGGDTPTQYEWLMADWEAERQTLFVDEYRPETERIVGLTMVDRGDVAADLVIVTAEGAEWDVARRDWRLVGGERLSHTRAVPVEWLGMSGVTPDDLRRLGKDRRQAAELSYGQLLHLQRLDPSRRDYVLGFHNHITFPLACLLLLLLALPLAVHFERGSKIERVVYSILLCAAYFLTDLTCQSLGRSELHPVLAAWLPTILFGSFGIVFFGSIRT